MQPIVKWVGGKRQLLNEIKKRLPKEFNVYFEPFIGGGALLFYFLPQCAHINDYNEELINLYQVIKSSNDSIVKLIKFLNGYEMMHSEDFFYQIRELDRLGDYKNISSLLRATRLIYLNKAGFNGLYRVNSKGHFNVPWGKKEKVKLYDLSNLENIHNYFINNNISITNLDFEAATINAQENDFVYFDPPYDPWENKNTFTTYTKDSFNREEQIRLFKLFENLTKRGVKCMLSNHNTEFIRNLYRDYQIDVVKARRQVNSKASDRGPVEEVIITNYSDFRGE